MSLKEAAQELLKVAEDIEKEAEAVTNFVCESCNHTATLETINARRKEVAKEAGENVVVSNITVNDVVSCPACGGDMKYSATEASEQYYINPQKEADDDENDDKGDEDDEDKKEEKEAKEPVNYDSM